MKHTWYIKGAIALTATFALASAAAAQTGDVSVSTSVDVNASATVETMPPKGPVPNASIREKLRADYEMRIQNVRGNQETRNGLLEERREFRQESRALATTTRGEIKDMRADGRIMMKNASTSAERKEIRQNLALNVFRAHHERLVKQLELALANLEQIRGRIVSRIEKAEEAGRTMTDARALLSMADGKITAAKGAIIGLKAYVPSAATTTASASSTTDANVDLGKPRQIGEAAITAVKEVQRALNAVVVAIAKSMGLKNGSNSSATTTVDVSATTTATTTP